ncbi:MAG TPA: hypothetical protein VHE12_05750 [bacterium]|nr:hypothetical protein [bacterium]
MILKIAEFFLPLFLKGAKLYHKLPLKTRYMALWVAFALVLGMLLNNEWQNYQRARIWAAHHTPEAAK